MCWLIFPFHLPFQSLNCLNLLPSDVDLVRIGVIGQDRQTSKDLAYQFMPERFLCHNGNLLNSKFLNLITQVSGWNSYLLEFINLHFFQTPPVNSILIFFWKQVLGYSKNENNSTKGLLKVKQQSLSIGLLFSGMLLRFQKTQH